MHVPRSRRLAVLLPLSGLALAVVGAVLAVRQSDASAVDRAAGDVALAVEDRAAWLGGWVERGLATARIAARYPTVQYVLGVRPGAAGELPFPVADGPVVHAQKILTSLCREAGFDAATVVTPEGTFAVTAGADAPGPPAVEGTRAAMTTGTAAVRFDASPAGGAVLFVAAVRGADGAPCGAVTLSQRVDERLAPALGTGMHRTRTGRLAVVHRAGAASQVLLAARAAGGSADATGLAALVRDAAADRVERDATVDGRRAVAAWRPVPGVPWTVVATIDRSEVVAEGRGPVLSIVFSVVAATLGLALALLGIVQRRRAEAQRAALASVARLAAALDEGPDLALFVRADGTVNEVRGAVGSILGADAAALVGRPLTALLPEVRAATGGLDRLAGGGLAEEHTVHRADGVEVPVEVSAVRLGGESSAARTLVRVRDVRERRHAAERIRFQHRLLLLRSVLSSAVAGARDLHDLYRATCSAAVEVGGFRLVWVGEPRADGSIVPVASAGEGTEHVPRLVSWWGPAPGPRGPAGRAAADGRTVTCAEVAADPECAAWVEAAGAAGVRSTVAVPVRGRTTPPAAAVLVLHAAAPDALGDEVVAAAEAIGTDLGVALARLASEAAARAAEGRLRTTEEGYRALFESHPSPMWVLDAKDLRLLAVNDAMVRAYGWSRDELLRMRVDDLFPPEDVAALHAAVDDYPAGAPLQREWRHRRRDGTVFPVRVLSGPIDFRGGLARIATAEDLTERRRAEEATRTLIRAVEQSPVSIVVTDRAGAIEYVNPQFTRVTGYGLDEVIGENPRVLKSPETPREVHVDLWRQITSGRVWRGELVNRRKDGSTFAERATIAPVHDAQGAITHFVAVKEDLTPQREMEARAQAAEERFLQAQKLEAVGRLAGGVAHDFNNLLCVILGYGQMAASALGHDHPEAGKLEQVVAAGKRAEALTRQLLAFSRRQVLSPRVVDLHEVVRGVEKMLRRLIGEDIELGTDLRATTPVVLVDPGQLEQVLLNLTVNARDALPHGGHITLRTASLDLTAPREVGAERLAPGPWVVLSVEDDGVGMDPATQARVFEPFFTTKPAGQGTGLGLATVHGIVRQSGGHVGFRSEVGRGTRFDVYLPRLHAAVDGAAGAEVDLRPFAGHERVLVVEDQEGVRELMRAWLEALGYAVLVAEDGEKALEVAAGLATPVDLLLTDVVMPRLGGRDLAERLGARWPGLRVLYVSGYTSDVIARQGVLEPGVRLVEKPLSQATLLQAVREVLDGKR